MGWKDLLLIGLGIGAAMLLSMVLLGKGQGVSYTMPNRFGMQEAENEETLEWTDWRGVPRKLTIHRTVRVKA